MRAFLRATGLSWFFFAIFVLSLVGLAIAGHAQATEEELRHARLLGEAPETMDMGRYLVSSHFWQAMMENWQSEYLQFALYIAATIWLVQRGSGESKPLDEAGRGAPSGLGMVRENSLLLVMGTIFALSWFAHSVTGWTEYNTSALEHEEHPVGWWSYVGTSDFWQTTMQNWQSEFLAVGSMVVLSVYLRQRGSPESKAVGAPHGETGAKR